MQLVCPRCARVLEYDVERPTFCSYCGSALGPREQSTIDVVSEPVLPLTTTSPSTIAPDGASLDEEAVESGRDAAPKSVGGYQVVCALGTGGMGTVYEAVEAASGRRVALKLIGRRFVASDEAVERFRQEGRLASMIAHPRCVFVLAADEEAGRPYIVMELMAGSTIRDLVDQQGPLPVEQAVTKILDVIE